MDRTSSDRTSSKVPSVTAAFWVAKILAATVGETGGDALSMTLHLGHAVSTIDFLRTPCDALPLRVPRSPAGRARPRHLTHAVTMEKFLAPRLRGEQLMDAIQFILRDHREIERLLKECERAERAEEPDRQGDAVRELIRALSIHAVIEEQFVYPALRDAGADTGVLDALEEHHAVKLTLSELETLAATNSRYVAKVRLLAENVRRHLADEEGELLPVLERALDDEERRALGDALDRAKRVAPTRPHPAAPDTPPGNFFAGAIAAVYDRSRDALRGGMDMLRTVAAQGSSRSLDAAKELASQARRRSRTAVNDAVEQGRAAMDAGLEKGREAMDEAREATARVEVRGAQAASTAARKGRNAARRTRAGKTRARKTRARKATARRRASTRRR